MLIFLRFYFSALGRRRRHWRQTHRWQVSSLNSVWYSYCFEAQIAASAMFFHVSRLCHVSSLMQEIVLTGKGSHRLAKALNANTTPSTPQQRGLPLSEGYERTVNPPPIRNRFLISGCQACGLRCSLSRDIYDEKNLVSYKWILCRKSQEGFLKVEVFLCRGVLISGVFMSSVAACRLFRKSFQPRSCKAGRCKFLTVSTQNSCLIDPTWLLSGSLFA